MNKEQLKSTGEAFLSIANSDGRHIQYGCEIDELIQWYDCGTLGTLSVEKAVKNGWPLRIKEPKSSRPMRPDELPNTFWIASRNGNAVMAWFWPVAIDDKCVLCLGALGTFAVYFTSADHHGYVWSPDRKQINSFRVEE